jgi:hypothetical protein
MKKFKMLMLTGVLTTSIIATTGTTAFAAQHQQNRMLENFGLTTTITTTDEEDKEDEKEYISLDEVEMSYSMDLGKPCGLSKEDFVELMENLPYDYTGFYSRNAEFIWDMEEEYQVNAIFYCGIVAQESGWAQYGYGNNYTGMMCSTGLICYESEEAGIEATFKNLSQNYIPCGRNTLASISTVYAGDSGWADCVYSAMTMIVSD